MFELMEWSKNHPNAHGLCIKMSRDCVEDFIEEHKLSEDMRKFFMDRRNQRMLQTSRMTVHKHWKQPVYEHKIYVIWIEAHWEGTAFKYWKIQVLGDDIDKFGRKKYYNYEDAKRSIEDLLNNPFARSILVRRDSI